MFFTWEPPDYLQEDGGRRLFYTTCSNQDTCLARFDPYHQRQASPVGRRQFCLEGRGMCEASILEIPQLYFPFFYKTPLGRDFLGGLLGKAFQNGGPSSGDLFLCRGWQTYNPEVGSVQIRGWRGAFFSETTMCITEGGEEIPPEVGVIKSRGWCQIPPRDKAIMGNIPSAITCPPLEY